MKPNEHPFAFTINDGGFAFVQPTLWQLVDVAEEAGIYAPDFAIRPIYPSTRGREAAVPQEVYAYLANGVWQWRETSNIRAIAMSRYYVPTPQMVQPIVEQYPEHVFLYLIEDSPVLVGFDVAVWAGRAAPLVQSHVGIMLGQTFPHHAIAQNFSHDGISYERSHEHCVRYRVAVVRNLDEHA